ncbi:MAG: ATP-binding protein [Bacillota bacterium]
MVDKPLIEHSQVIGIFRGFSEGGLEFHADLVLPYRSEYQYIPMHGQFVLVQLAHENEAVLGRITSLRSEGRLVSPEGEDYSIRIVTQGQLFPEDLREQYLKYRVNIRVLGVIRQGNNGEFTFVPSHRRLPHVGSPVAFPDTRIVRYIAGHDGPGAELGFLAMGEFIWGREGTTVDSRLEGLESNMQVIEPRVIVRFSVDNLVSRRTFVFARAGFGKSNLVKLLFSELYRETPTVKKRGERRVPVGTIIFDREGEYFWPDDKGRPGLCDVPHLQSQLVVFTCREPPSAFYGSFVAGGIKLDIRRLPASTVASIALSPERQDQQNVRKIKGLSAGLWKELVDLIYRYGNGAELMEVKRILNLDAQAGDAEAIAARSNMTTIVNMLHDPNSRLLDLLTSALALGKLCVVDLSQFSGEAALAISGLMLQYLFDHNQREFTKREAATIPVIAVLEEAQSVLGQGHVGGNNPYVVWVKEGRKYDLGAVIITQQPGSIPDELLSQGDNWFVFHLLAAGDLKAIQRANAHFSEDLLSSVLNEPIAGHCVFWSSAGGKPFPLPVRVLSFERVYPMLDPHYNRQEVSTCVGSIGIPAVEPSGDGEEERYEALGTSDKPDYLTSLQDQALQRLRGDARFTTPLRKEGQIAWGKVVGLLQEHITRIDGSISQPNTVAKDLVRVALDRFFGLESAGRWRTERVNGKLVIIVSKDSLDEFFETEDFQ